MQSKSSLNTCQLKTLSNVQNPCSLSNTSLYVLFCFFGLVVEFFVRLFLFVCFFLFHSWKLKNQVMILDGWCPSSTWHNPHVYLSKGEKVLTHWVVSFATSDSGKYINTNKNDGKAFTCPSRLEYTTQFISWKMI